MECWDLEQLMSYQGQMVSKVKAICESYVIFSVSLGSRQLPGQFPQTVRSGLGGRLIDGWISITTLQVESQ